jgi:hypothetical protein
MIQVTDNQRLTDCSRKRPRLPSSIYGKKWTSFFPLIERARGTNCQNQHQQRVHAE